MSWVKPHHFRSVARVNERNIPANFFGSSLSSRRGHESCATTRVTNPKRPWCRATNIYTLLCVVFASAVLALPPRAPGAELKASLEIGRPRGTRALVIRTAGGKLVGGITYKIRANGDLLIPSVKITPDFERLDLGAVLAQGLIEAFPEVNTIAAHLDDADRATYRAHAGDPRAAVKATRLYADYARAGFTVVASVTEHTPELIFTRLHRTPLCESELSFVEQDNMLFARTHDNHCVGVLRFVFIEDESVMSPATDVPRRFSRRGVGRILAKRALGLRPNVRAVECVFADDNQKVMDDHAASGAEAALRMTPFYRTYAAHGYGQILVLERYPGLTQVRLGRGTP